jgi:hypothetical protein
MNLLPSTHQMANPEIGSSSTIEIEQHYLIAAKLDRSGVLVDLGANHRLRKA